MHTYITAIEYQHLVMNKYGTYSTQTNSCEPTNLRFQQSQLYILVSVYTE